MLKSVVKVIQTQASNHRKKLPVDFEKDFFVSLRTLGLILIYYFFSIGITFYQKWFIKRFHYPLTVVVCHMIVKFLLAALFRYFYRHFTGQSRITLSFKENVRKISLPGVASALDIGFSNWSFEFITISLYTMTKSTCVVFILGFAILFDLEKMRASLISVVMLISMGLFMFTYKSTQFHLEGFCLVLSASMLSGLRWTLSQKLMQRKESALSNPIDMMYLIQPWMIVGLLPLAFFFEAIPFFQSMDVNMEYFSMAYFRQIVDLILIGSLLAFLMEFSEYLLLTFTSSLTLSMAGIFKEVFTLYLAVNFNGDQMSTMNFTGLIICLFGISVHVVLKALDSRPRSSESIKPSHLRPVPLEEFESTTRLLACEDDVIMFDRQGEQSLHSDHHQSNFSTKNI